MSYRTTTKEDGTVSADPNTREWWRNIAKGHESAIGDLRDECNVYRRALEFIQAISLGGTAGEVAKVALDYVSLLQKAAEEMRAHPGFESDDKWCDPVPSEEPVTKYDPHLYPEPM